MENASKAVIMAGSVLIAIAVISIALYAYGIFSGYAESSEETLTATQIASFNRFYQSYEEGTDTIRGVDVINIINRAEDDEIESVPSIPSELTGDDQAEHYLDKYNYSLDYDVQGRVSKISIN